MEVQTERINEHGEYAQGEGGRDGSRREERRLNRYEWQDHLWFVYI